MVVRKTFAKLQAIQTVIVGLQSIANGLQKENAAVLLLSNIREKALIAVQILRNFVTRGTVTATVQSTAATVGSTAALATNTIATRVASGALIGFRAALIATGIGALLVLLTSAASAMGVFGEETKEATVDIDAFNKRLEFSKELLQGQVDGLKFAGKIQEEKLKQLRSIKTE